MNITDEAGNVTPRYLRRAEAARFLTERGFPTAKASLDTYAVTGAGPVFRRVGRIPLYTEAELLAWVAARTSKPVKSTSELAA